MSRSGYTDDNDDPLALGRWRAIIVSATRGRRGQAFFHSLADALDAMPDKRLVANELEDEETGGVCTLGALAKQNGVSLDPDDTYDYEKLGATFNIANQLAQETMWMNDEAGPRRGETPEERWTRVRKWVASQIKPPATPERTPPHE